MMVARDYYEHTVTSLAGLNRRQLKKRIKDFKGRFKMDFSEDYLDNISVDRLRHILLAALINSR
jgi:hypothetical protein